MIGSSGSQENLNYGNNLKAMCSKSIEATGINPVWFAEVLPLRLI
jgi:hypothetical protein